MLPDPFDCFFRLREIASCLNECITVFRSIQEIPGMRALVEQLRNIGYEVNLVTNIRSENLDLVEPFRPLFDQVVHCPKHPGERQAAWKAEWASHSIAPNQFLLIDDQEANIQEAKALGMEAILFQDAGSLKTKLIQHQILN